MRVPGRILVIRLGALGDFVLSFGAFAAIRAHHAGAHVVLLTTAPFGPLAVASPWFDEVRIDRRPGVLDPLGLVRLVRQLRGFDMVYDLQTSGRSSRYFRLAGRPPWSGIAAGCSHPHANPRRDSLHTVERQRDQLAAAGTGDVARPDVRWLARAGPRIAARYALLIPGTSAAHGGAKRWPPARYGAIASVIAESGTLPVVVGGAGDRAAAAEIIARCAETVDLTGRTTLVDLAGLAARAAFAVGGDTGPVHLAAVMGCPVVALFSRWSDPTLAGPVGRTVLVREADLGALSVERVVAALPAS